MERIGIDMGGTKIELARVADDGTVIAHTRIPTNAPNGVDDMINRIATALSQLGAGGDAPVGVGCAGVVENGVIKRAVNLGWENIPLQHLLIDRLNRRVVVENDVRAALIGETRYGVAQGKSDVIYIAVGTGLGAAALVNGQILRGFRGMAMELGQIRQPDGTIIEQVASGSGLSFIAMHFNLPVTDTHAVLNLVRQGDLSARLALDTIIGTICTLGVWSCTMLNPQILIIGGGMALAISEWLMPRLQVDMQTRCADFIADGLQITHPQVSNSAVGASALVG